MNAPNKPTPDPIPMRIPCPECRELHIDGLADDGTDWAKKPHHTHACQACGHVWRPAVVNTVGVRFLPGFRNAASLPKADA
jgi:rubredoxin